MSLSTFEQDRLAEMSREKWIDWFLLVGCIAVAALALAVARLLPR